MKSIKDRFSGGLTKLAKIFEPPPPIPLSALQNIFGARWAHFMPAHFCGGAYSEVACVFARKQDSGWDVVERVARTKETVLVSGLSGKDVVERLEKEAEALSERYEHGGLYRVFDTVGTTSWNRETNLVTVRKQLEAGDSFSDTAPVAQMMPPRM